MSIRFAAAIAAVGTLVPLLAEDQTTPRQRETPVGVEERAMLVDTVRWRDGR